VPRLPAVAVVADVARARLTGLPSLAASTAGDLPLGGAGGSRCAAAVAGGARPTRALGREHTQKRATRAPGIGGTLQIKPTMDGTGADSIFSSSGIPLVFLLTFATNPRNAGRRRGRCLPARPRRSRHAPPARRSRTPSEHRPLRWQNPLSTSAAGIRRQHKPVEEQHRPVKLQMTTSPLAAR
jgi:hypothetical protein